MQSAKAINDIQYIKINLIYHFFEPWLHMQNQCENSHALSIFLIRSNILNHQITNQIPIKDLKYNTAHYKCHYIIITVINLIILSFLIKTC